MDALSDSSVCVCALDVSHACRTAENTVQHGGGEGDARPALLPTRVEKEGRHVVIVR